MSTRNYWLVRIFFTIAIVGTVVWGFFNIHLPSPAPKAPEYSINSDVLTTLVNKWRASERLPEYKTDQSLCEYAQVRSEQIITEWNHDQFHKDKCSKADYPTCGENLAGKARTESDILLAWLLSPTHKDNLKDGDFTNMCIRCTSGYCAQEFGGN